MRGVAVACCLSILFLSLSLLGGFAGRLPAWTGGPVTAATGDESSAPVVPENETGISAFYAWPCYAVYLLRACMRAPPPSSPLPCCPSNYRATLVLAGGRATPALLQLLADGRRPALRGCQLPAGVALERAGRGIARCVRWRRWA